MIFITKIMNKNWDHVLKKTLFSENCKFYELRTVQNGCSATRLPVLSISTRPHPDNSRGKR